MVLNAMHTWIQTHHISSLVVVSMMAFFGLFVGKAMKRVKLPSIIGFMLVGVLLGPSLFGVLGEETQSSFSFITEIALGFVAVSIGLELNLATLKKQGLSMILIILSESLLAFLVVTGAVFVLTKNLPLSLIFGAIAPASAPAGTVAVIHEYKAKGPLTKALYTVVGFDDGLGIIIFGFASSLAKSLLTQQAGGEDPGMLLLLLTPLKEIGLSLLMGAAAAVITALILRKLKNGRDIFILMFSFVLLLAGLSSVFHTSLILTNMVFGIILVNSMPHSVVSKIHEGFSEVMPLLFVLFFVLAGANLHVAALPSLGLLGVIYILARSGGLMGGAFLGAIVGKAPDVIRKYLGLGILSQAGVAIGLSLIVKHDFSSISQAGADLGITVITTVTATCIFFELIGPIFTKIGLEKAGEIAHHDGKAGAKRA